MINLTIVSLTGIFSKLNKAYFAYTGYYNLLNTTNRSPVSADCLLLEWIDVISFNHMYFEKSVVEHNKR